MSKPWTEYKDALFLIGLSQSRADEYQGQDQEMRTNRVYHPTFPLQSTCKRAGQIPDGYCITRQKRRLSGRSISGKSHYNHSKLCLLDFFLSFSHSNQISLCFAWHLFFLLTFECLMSLFVLAFVLQWSYYNKQLAFCNIADACAIVYIDECWTIQNPLQRGLRHQKLLKNFYYQPHSRFHRAI